MERRIKLFIVDFYGVMTLGSYKNTCQYLAKKYHRNADDLYKVIYHKYFNLAVMKKIPARTFLKKALIELRLPEDPAKLAERHLTFQKLNRPVFTMCRKLQKKGTRVLLLSKNLRAEFYPLLKRMHIRRYFRNIINTYDLNLSKDSPQTIRFILKKFHVRPDEIIMTDDQDFNLVEPKKVGVHTILYKSVQQLKHELRTLLEFQKND